MLEASLEEIGGAGLGSGGKISKCISKAVPEEHREAGEDPGAGRRRLQRAVEMDPNDIPQGWPRRDATGGHVLWRWIWKAFRMFFLTQVTIRIVLS
jgi:hypothetical protein